LRPEGRANHRERNGGSAIEGRRGPFYFGGPVFSIPIVGEYMTIIKILAIFGLIAIFDVILGIVAIVGHWITGSKCRRKRRMIIDARRRLAHDYRDHIDRQK
jgi:hypothetical protein